MTPQQKQGSAELVKCFHSLLTMASQVDGEQFAQVTISRMFGPIADEEWEMMRVQSELPCGASGCNCQDFRKRTFAGLSAARDYYRQERAKIAPPLRPGRPAADLHNHVAGNYQDGMQFCVICGGVLIDDRGVMVLDGDKPPAGFPPGADVCRKGPGTIARKDESLPDCGE